MGRGRKLILFNNINIQKTLTAFAYLFRTVLAVR